MNKFLTQAFLKAADSLNVKILFLAFLSIACEAGESSLYNGEESRFANQDRIRVINVLQNMGIPYRVSQDKRILVSDKSIEDVKDIVAAGFKAQYSQRTVSQETQDQ
jgi:flagellar biosynthesis/type III secretory pathway M-ring protein FliF/YscJ